MLWTILWGTGARPDSAKSSSPSFFSLYATSYFSESSCIRVIPPPALRKIKRLVLISNWPYLHEIVASSLMSLWRESV